MDFMDFMDFMISSLYMDLILELYRFLILLSYLFTYVIRTPMETSQSTTFLDYPQ